MSSTELATIDPPTQTGMANIEQTARALTHAHQIGDALCRTAFVPKHFQGKPDDAAAAILYGSTIDMDPVTALQNVYVIGGKPALYARTMVAIVMSHGHQVWTEDESDGSVTVAGQRKGSKHVERVTWTTKLAADAGYTSNAKYKSDPRSMLYARASGDVARRIAPDALLGMAHNVEELIVEADEPAQPRMEAKSEAAADRMGAILGTAAEPEPEPALNPSSAVARKMFAAMGDIGIADKPDRLKYVSDVVGREIASSKDMTEAEAQQVIEAAEADTAHLADVTDAEVLPEPDGWDAQ